LYSSLRATIIDEIYREFPQGHDPDGYLPVKTILGLSDMTLKSIMDDNDELQNYFPPHLIGLKENNPDDPIDADMPPLRGIVDAIRFLKQHKLPGSLLGKWQFPLPDIEVFRPPTMIPAAPRPRSGNSTAADEAQSTNI
jgi:hypothetical protein